MAWATQHGWAVLVGIASVTLVLVSGVGGSMGGQPSAVMAHHYAHIALPSVAFLIFSGGVCRDIRRNGRPSFSWRL
jgi:hypothetical protein